MIEKLHTDSDTMAHVENMTDKINELVDAVNRQEEAIAYLSKYSGEEYLKLEEGVSKIFTSKPPETALTNKTMSQDLTNVGDVNQGPSVISFTVDENVEILRITKEGFFVRGEKVDDKDDVYGAFSEWIKIARIEQDKFLFKNEKSETA